MSETLTPEELDVIIEAAHPSRPDREALTRQHVERILAVRLADVSARLAAVEALADEWADVTYPSPDGNGTYREVTTSGRYSDALRAALRLDPSEARP